MQRAPRRTPSSLWGTLPPRRALERGRRPSRTWARLAPPSCRHPPFYPLTSSPGWEFSATSRAQVPAPGGLENSPSVPNRFHAGHLHSRGSQGDRNPERSHSRALARVPTSVSECSRLLHFDRGIRFTRPSPACTDLVESSVRAALGGVLGTDPSPTRSSAPEALPVQRPGGTADALRASRSTDGASQETDENSRSRELTPTPTAGRVADRRRIQATIPLRDAQEENRREERLDVPGGAGDDVGNWGSPQSSWTAATSSASRPRPFLGPLTGPSFPQRPLPHYSFSVVQILRLDFTIPRRPTGAIEVSRPPPISGQTFPTTISGGTEARNA